MMSSAAAASDGYQRIISKKKLHKIWINENNSNKKFVIGNYR